MLCLNCSDSLGNTISDGRGDSGRVTQLVSGSESFWYKVCLFLWLWQQINTNWVAKTAHIYYFTILYGRSQTGSQNQGFGRAVFFSGGWRNKSVFLTFLASGGCPCFLSWPLPPSSKLAMLHLPDRSFVVLSPWLTAVRKVLQSYGFARLGWARLNNPGSSPHVKVFHLNHSCKVPFACEAMYLQVPVTRTRASLQVHYFACHTKGCLHFQ